MFSNIIFVKLIAEQPKNCKNPFVLIKDEELVSLCMESNPWDLRFVICNSSKTEQRWIIFKTENGRNHIRICQPYVNPSLKSKYTCLTADSSPIPDKVYLLFAQDYATEIKPNKEARDLKELEYNQGDTSQEWQMNSTTHQLANVKYPNVCITTRHFYGADQTLLVECNGYGYKSPNPRLTNKHQQRFNFTPALDKNGEQPCFD